MTSADTVLTNKPDLLFHYTSQKGLMGIVSLKSIWASSIRYLNDSAEFKYAIALTLEEYETIQKSASTEDLHFLDEIAEDIQNHHYSNVFACSFSEAGDLLRNYLKTHLSCRMTANLRYQINAHANCVKPR